MQNGDFGPRFYLAESLPESIAMQITKTGMLAA